MKDKFTEDIIKREKNDGNIAIVAFFVLMAVIFFALNLLRILPGGFLLCLFSGYAAYYFAGMQNVEYEFSMANEHVEVDAIYNMQRRKSLVSFNLQDAKLVAPTDSGRMEHERKSVTKTYYFGSGEKARSCYSILGEFNGKQTEIVVEPTEKILEHIQYICKNIYYEN